MDVNFAVFGELIQRCRPHHSVLAHRLTPLLHASFRPSPAMTPLRFAITSPHLDVKRTYTSKLSFMHGVRKYPPAKPVALRLLAPQRDLFATVQSKSKNKSKNLVLLCSRP